MMETPPPFKTKLCLLYQRGRCGRQTCTFAHGDAELRRRHSSNLPADRRSARRDNNDLRNILGRRKQHSPQKGFSPPPLPTKRRRYRSYQLSDDQSDVSRTFTSADGSPERIKDKKFVISESRTMIEDDEWKQIKYEVDVLLDENSRLKVELEERGQEADSLSSRYRDLEVQLLEEKGKFKRVNSKIRMLIRAHGQHFKLQDKIKRSQLQLEQLVKELGTDATQIDCNEDHLNVNIISDEEVGELKDDACPRNRSVPCNMEVPQGSNSGSLHLPVVTPVSTLRGHVIGGDATRRNYLRVDGDRVVEVGHNRGVTAHPSRESKPKRRKDASKKYGSSDPDGLQQQVWDSTNVAPPTGMAAHATDDFVEQEMDECTEDADETASVIQTGLPFLLPPIPPVTNNGYLQYEGDDEDVNVDGADLC